MKRCAIVSCLVVAAAVPVVHAELVDLVITGSWEATDFDVSSTGVGDPEGDDDKVFGVAPSAGSTAFTIRVDTSSSTGLFSAGYLSNGTHALTHDWIGYTDVTLIGTHTFGSATWENDGIATRLVGVDGLTAALWSDTDITTGNPSRASFRMFGEGDDLTADIFVGSRGRTTIGTTFQLWEFFSGEGIFGGSYLIRTVPAVVSFGLPNVAIETGADGTTVITGTDEFGLVLIEITLPDGTSFPSGTVDITFDDSGANAFIDMTGADVPVPPGKSIRILANPGSNFVCTVDEPGLVSVVGLPTCGSTDTSISQVVMECDGTIQMFSGFPDAPNSRNYTCTTSFENGQDYVTVDGLAFSFVSPFLAEPSPAIPTVSEWGMATLVLLLLTGITIKLRRPLIANHGFCLMVGAETRV